MRDGLTHWKSGRTGPTWFIVAGRVPALNSQTAYSNNARHSVQPR